MSWVKVDSSWLPAHLEGRADLVVELWPDGQLKRLARMVGSTCARELTLLHGVAEGRQIDHHGSGGSADWTSHADGLSENHDAWSDNSRPWADPFPEFVRRSIQRVLG